MFYELTYEEALETDGGGPVEEAWKLIPTEYRVLLGYVTLAYFVYQAGKFIGEEAASAIWHSVN